MPCHYRRLPLAIMIASLFSTPAHAQGDNGGSLSYQDERSHVGIGVSDEGDIVAELKYLLAATPTSGTVGEIWASGGAGGVKLSHNWMPADSEGRPDRAGTVRKFFGALDQNSEGDRKLSLGGGLENERGYLAAYLSHAISGRRNLADRQDTSTATVYGDDNGRPYAETTTLITTIRSYEHPFDWGVGVRAGRHFSDQGLRIGVGLDHEWGDDDSSQTSLSADIEKQILGGPWSIAARAEAVVQDKGMIGRDNDLRGWVVVRYDFGQPVRSPATYSLHSLAPAVMPVVAGKPADAGKDGAEVRVKQNAAWNANRQALAQPPEPAPEVMTEKTEKRLVKTTASMTADAFFKFDKATLTPVASQALDKVAGILVGQGYADKISVTGHTCDIGSEAYNEKLSQRRANSVKKYLVEQGKLKADDIAATGMGERNPLYPNVKGQRQKNRRVEVEFLTYVDKEESYIVRVPTTPTEATVVSSPAYQAELEKHRENIAAPAAEPDLVISREIVESEPAWIQHALFGTVPHKRTVDYYRVSHSSVTTATERTYLNRAPVAGNDSYTASNGLPITMAVLSNDSDPDNDVLSITSVSQGALGNVVISGNTLVYTPSSTTQNGTDTFSYTISDGNGGSATATVTVTLIANLAPTAVPDRYVIPGVTSQLFNVLANDTDPEGDALSIIAYTQPGHGEVSLEDNRIRYTSVATFSVLTFTYTISDTYGGTSTTTVTLVDP